MADISGFININKNKGWSSHDCVARLRRLLNTKKIGHSGTLDPLATGVLPIAVGRATRLIQYLPSQKAYRATVRFGVTTSTDDLEGEVLSQQSAAHLQQSEVEALLPQFLGTLLQTPPMFSAVQVDGKRLYDLARKGQQVEVPTREVSVRALTVVDWKGRCQTPELVLDVACGPGTYIRSLARDMGVAAGTGATLAGLVRSHSNGFSLDQSLTIDELEETLNGDTFAPLAAGEAVRHLNAISLSPALAKRWCQGQKLALEDPEITAGAGSVEELMEEKPLRVLCEQKFLGIGEIRVSNYGEADAIAHRILAARMVFTPY